MCSKVTKYESPVILKVQQKLAGDYRMFVKVADTLIQLSSSCATFPSKFADRHMSNGSCSACV